MHISNIIEEALQYLPGSFSNRGIEYNEIYDNWLSILGGKLGEHDVLLVRICTAHALNIWDPYREDSKTGEWPKHLGDEYYTPNAWTFYKECLEALPDDTVVEGMTKQEIIAWWNEAHIKSWDQPYEIILVKSR